MHPGARGSGVTRATAAAAPAMCPAQGPTAASARRLARSWTTDERPSAAGSWRCARDDPRRGCASRCPGASGRAANSRTARLLRTASQVVIGRWLRVAELRRCGADPEAPGSAAAAGPVGGAGRLPVARRGWKIPASERKPPGSSSRAVRRSGSGRRTAGTASARAAASSGRARVRRAPWRGSGRWRRGRPGTRTARSGARPATTSVSVTACGRAARRARGELREVPDRDHPVVARRGRASPGPRSRGRRASRSPTRSCGPRGRR